MPNSRNRNSDRSMMSQWGETARDNPIKSAAAAAGAVAAGVFLWSKRNEISDQISRLGDQVSDWADEMRSSSTGRQLMKATGMNESDAIEASRAGGSRSRSSRSSGNSSKASSRTTRANSSAGSETMAH